MTRTQRSQSEIKRDANRGIFHAHEIAHIKSTPVSRLKGAWMNEHKYRKPIFVNGLFLQKNRIKSTQKIGREYNVIVVDSSRASINKFENAVAA